MYTKLRLEVILEHGDAAERPELLATALEAFTDKIRADGLDGPAVRQVPRGQLAFVVSEDR